MRDSVYAHAPAVHCLYLEFRAVQKMPVVFSSLGTAEMHVLRPFEREGFLCALAYQVALDFRAKSECERKNLGLDVVSEAVAVLYRPDPRALFHNQVALDFRAKSECERKNLGLIVSSIQAPTSSEFFLQNRRISNRWFSTVCLSVLTRM